MRYTEKEEGNIKDLREICEELFDDTVEFNFLATPIQTNGVNFLK